MYKIKFKSPTQEGQILTYTCEKYELGESVITFVDKFQKKQVWNMNSLLNIEEVEE